MQNTNIVSFGLRFKGLKDLMSSSNKVISIICLNFMPKPHYMRFVLVLIFALSALSMMGQNREELKPCGTAPFKSQWLKHYQKNKDAYPDKVLTEIFIPLNIAIVGEDGGAGRYSESSLIQSLCTLNEDFEGTEITFFLNDYRTIYDSDYFEHEDVLVGAAKMMEYDLDTGVNCYLLGNPAGNCGYNLPYAGIALSNSCATPSDHTWAHEIGHAFSLPHPFLGWEGGVGYEGEIGHDFNDPAPETVLYNYTTFQDTLILDTLIIDTAYVELLDGSNCHIAADGFCDTKPDYLAARWACDSNFESFNEQTDPSGGKFKSDGTLIMSYAFDACSSRFSEEQILAMRASAEEEDADIILVETPTTGEIVGNGNIELYPVYDPELDYTEVIFNWGEVEHADYYLFQLGLGDGMSVIFFDTIVQSPKLIVDEINPNLPFVWAVTPFNKTDFCDVESSAIMELELTDVSSTKEEELNRQVRLIPNILTESNNIQIASGSERFNSYEVYAYTGEKIQSGKLSGQEISLQQRMNPGMYFVVLKNASRQVSLKFLQQ